MSITLECMALGRDRDDCNHWVKLRQDAQIDYAHSAAVLCDLWDAHWNQGASRHMVRMLPAINALTDALRAAGALIVHAPSDTMEHYAGTPARLRALQCPQILPTEVRNVADAPHPLDASDGGNDAREPRDRVDRRVWTRQHPDVIIDQARDLILDDGVELHSCLQARQIQRVFMLGVHANMCVLERSFGIKNLVRWGYSVALVRDLTDPMYNPALPPYVNRSEALRLSVEYVEKFWCSSVASAELISDARAAAQV